MRVATSSRVGLLTPAALLFALNACVDLGGLSGGIDGGTAEAAMENPGPESGAADTATAEDAGRDAPACSGACIAAAPPGWQGPLELYVDAGAAPACGIAYSSSPAFDGHDSLTAAAGSCACTCGAPNGLTCANETLTFYGGANCGGATVGTATITPTCAPITTPGGVASFSLSTPAALGGTCAPAANNSIPPVSWADVARACLPLGTLETGACGPGDVCAPPPDPGFLGKLCISVAGVATCPAPYVTQHVEYASLSDTRACTPCTCGQVTGATTDPQTLEGANACNSIGFASSCFSQLPPLGTNRWSENCAASGGSCLPSSTGPTGNAAPTQPTTFCCLP